MILSLPRDTTKYNIAKTDTFRLGSSMMLESRADYENRNYGGNRQNLEKNMRQLWKADEGYMLCQVDQSGAEALIVSYLCIDAKYRSLFKNGIKPHTYLALRLFPEVWGETFGTDKITTALACSIPQLKALPYWKDLAKLIADSDNWTSNKRYYHFAKKTIHAGSYGMKENTFRMSMLKESGGTINLTFDQAAKFLDGFHREFPEIRLWHGRVYEQVQKCGRLVNMFGFPYQVTDYVNKDDFKDLIAWVPQSTVACITRQAYVRLYNFAAEHKKSWHLLHDTHDSYLAECPENEIEELGKTMREFIEIELVAPDQSKFRMKSSVAIGRNWAPYKKDKNEEGLKEI